ncbi:succinylglutamate desuccinylase/aspartoacylase family protein [Flavilitoribacter nigricans]|uniref:Succinylglutamate desuccinylase n=1 Tax=Flavilitoribacter nigricans (strain ATCC 23147 / DSM 23189 / NBRC 102662 / NCIMB 1420 / SS-2) TaxID=1122177 RepID=A0A2D0NAU0_FLAN2|nr:succinylglutamate desuccinylase/aspartoacylase family protein [Flavilitoribacter nigricans]PHN05605.1 succinylglutamate desuccinylase [Flavilitoribacter nigricans DSM 23189 = NBRC 102662]
MERIIGKFTGPERGPLLICLGGMHGNEPAGILAMENLFQMLAVEPEVNPDFHFCGRIIGLRGNLQALAAQQRYLEKDLNRQFTLANVKRVRSTPESQLAAEDLELRQLLDIVQREIEEYAPECLYFLDLHTTTAEGGIFAITTDDKTSIRIGVELHAPVITGMLKGLKGTTLHYFNTQNLGVPTVAITFEAGQHDDPLSVNRTIAAIVNCLRTVGCVKAEHVENRHDQLLQDYARYLPKVAHLIKAHRIQPDDGFTMLPGYQNFQKVKKGETLAYDHKGPIHADVDAHVLMPHYQQKGEDGFFLVKEVKRV